MTVARAQDLPETRAALLDWYQRHGSDYFTACIESGGQRLHFPTTNAEAAGRWYSHTESRRLATAELFWISREMTELCVAAARSMPEWNLFPDDMPSPAGFIYFEGLPDLREFPATAFSWGPCAQKIIDGMGLKGPSVWVSHYTDISELQITTTRLPLPQLIYGSESMSAFGHREPGDLGYTATGREDFTEATDRDLTTKASSLVILKTAWLLMQQGVGDATELSPDRAARKRLARAGQEPASVRVVTLRRPKRSFSEPGDGDREYHHQWIVRGHWRQHWHPKREVHRPVWIAPHVKGPEGAPLIGGEKVYALKR